MNLLAYVREMAGQEGIFENADLSRMGIWGHSIGGGIALRVINLVPEIKAAVLYAAVSQRYNNNSEDIQIYDLETTDAAFSVHHGVMDDTIYVSSSQTLCEDLKKCVDVMPNAICMKTSRIRLSVPANADPLFIQRTVDFFARYLKDK